MAVCDGFSIDVTRSSHSRLVSKSSSSSSSSSSVLYQPLQPPIAVTAANVISPPVFPRQSQSITDEAHFHWSSSTTEQDQRLSQVATGDGHTSLQQVPVDYHHQSTPTTSFLGSPSGASSVLLAHECQESPDMKHDSFLVQDHAAVDGYDLACTNDVRSYVNLMTSGTLRGSGGFTNIGHVINYVTNDACCSDWVLVYLVIMTVLNVPSDAARCEMSLRNVRLVLLDIHLSTLTETCNVRSWPK